MNDMSLKQLYEADWASEAVASSSDEDKEQIRALEEQYNVTNATQAKQVEIELRLRTHYE